MKPGKPTVRPVNPPWYGCCHAMLCPGPWGGRCEGQSKCGSQTMCLSCGLLKCARHFRVAQDPAFVARLRSRFHRPSFVTRAGAPAMPRATSFGISPKGFSLITQLAPVERTTQRGWQRSCVQIGDRRRLAAHCGHPFRRAVEPGDRPRLLTATGHRRSARLKPCSQRPRRNGAKLRLDSVVSKPKLARSAASTLSRRSMSLPASMATLSVFRPERPCAIRSAFTNSRIPRTRSTDSA